MEYNDRIFLIIFVIIHHRLQTFVEKGRKTYKTRKNINIFMGTHHYEENE